MPTGDNLLLNVLTQLTEATGMSCRDCAIMTVLTLWCCHGIMFLCFTCLSQNVQRSCENMLTRCLLSGIRVDERLRRLSSPACTKSAVCLLCESSSRDTVVNRLKHPCIDESKCSGNGILLQMSSRRGYRALAFETDYR